MGRTPGLQIACYPMCAASYSGHWPEAKTLRLSTMPMPDLPGPGDYEFFPKTNHPHDPRNDADDEIKEEEEDDN
ncbi:MAG: hypothetical protein ACR2K1_08485 [Saprospiraceae bacterium]